MAGLLSTKMGVDSTNQILGSGNVDSVAATGIDPEKRQVDAAKETVSGQLDSLLKASSPYIERARAGAAQYANKRGLLNSSIAAGAGEAAAIDAALPIANADAQIYGAASRDNQNAGNTALQFNAEGLNQVAMQGLKGEQASLLANIEGSYKSLIQSSDSAGKLYQQAMDAINKTLTSADIEPSAKDAAVARQTELLKIGLGVIGKIGELDLTSLLNFGAVNA